MTLQILDINGKLVAQPFTNYNAVKGENQLNYNIADWLAGVYFYTVQTDTQRLSGKFIKQ